MIEDLDHEAKKKRKNIKKRRDKIVQRVVRSIEREITEITLNLSINREKENKRDIDTTPQAVSDRSSLLFYSLLHFNKFLDCLFHRHVAF
jgi:hypothetical protein